MTLFVYNATILSRSQPNERNRSMKILVIDDSKGVVENICRAAHKAGIEAIGLTEMGPRGIYSHEDHVTNLSLREAVMWGLA